MSVRREDLRQDIAVALSGEPEFRAAINEKFVVPRVAVLGHVLDRARDRGELGPGQPGRRLTAEAATSFVIGPLHHRVYVMGRQPTPAFQKGVVVAPWRRCGRSRPSTDRVLSPDPTRRCPYHPGQGCRHGFDGAIGYGRRGREAVGPSIPSPASVEGSTPCRWVLVTRLDLVAELLPA